MPPKNSKNAEIKQDISWISNEFLENCLKKTINSEQIYLESVEWGDGKTSTKGENYCSDIHHLLLCYKTSTSMKEQMKVHLIVKTPPPGDFGNFVTGTGFFSREIQMYTKTLPAMEAHRPRGHANTSYTQWNAKCYFAGSTPVPTLILEDLSIPGFKLANRQVGLDQESVLLTLTSLARFHAASHSLSLVKPREFDEYDVNPLCGPDQRAYMKYFTKGSVKALILEMDTWPDKKWRKITERVRELTDCLLDIGYKASLRDNDSFNVMNHGDYWVNNFMFLYDSNNKPIDIRYVDFQLGHFSSPMIDFHYFICSSLSEEARINGYEKYLKHYYNTLISALESLDLKGPSYEEMKKDYDRRIGYGLFASISIVPIVLCPSHHAIDMNEWKAIKGEITERVPAFGNPRYKQIISSMLEDLVQRDVI